MQSKAKVRFSYMYYAMKMCVLLFLINMMITSSRKTCFDKKSNPDEIYGGVFVFGCCLHCDLPTL